MRGKALRQSDKEIDEQAQPTPEDIERAKAFWKRNAPQGAKDILEATPEDVDV